MKSKLLLALPALRRFSVFMLSELALSFVDSYVDGTLELGNFF